MQTKYIYIYIYIYPWGGGSQPPGHFGLLAQLGSAGPTRGTGGLPLDPPGSRLVPTGTDAGELRVGRFVCFGTAQTPVKN